MTTLDPRRAERTPIVLLSDSPAVRGALETLDAAIVRHFPENLFADLDALAAALVARGADAPALADRIAALHGLFGRETALRFRYAHDFLYGYDWARWVAREPAMRARVGPYDDAFLAYSERRAAELLALVAQNDRKYGPLEGDAHRNPFPFRRDVEAERTLHRALAADDAVPVRAWDAAAPAVWDRPFTAIREEKAREMGLTIAR